MLNFVGLANLLSPEYEAFQVPVESGGIPVVTNWFLWSTARRNLETHVWTINDSAEMEQLIQMGVDGIMTDRPERLLDLTNAQTEATHE